MQRLSTLLMATLLSLPVLAQDQDQGQEQEQSQQQAEQQGSGKAADESQVPQQARNSSGQRAEKNADDYRPSEEISEDLSVSYPVDI